MLNAILSDNTTMTGNYIAYVDGVFGDSGTFTMHRSCTYTLTLSMNPPGSGSVTKNPNKSTYCPGEQVTLTANPNSGYVFSSWSGVDSSSGTTASVTINGNRTVTANFSQISVYTLTANISPPGSGSVTKNPNKVSYNLGEVVTLSAIPNAGYTFTNWTGDQTGTNNPVTILMNSNKTITANFTVQPGPNQGVIELPQTGQTKCYNFAGAEVNCAGTGQDGELQEGAIWPTPRFTVTGNCVTDNLTGLVWSKNANLPNGTRSWQEALSYVASINSGSGLCGYKDWRLPNVNELESLINDGEANSATWLLNQGFINVESVIHWTSTSLANDPSGTMVVGVWGGGTSFGPKSNNYYVWPVRSGPETSAPSKVWRTGQTTKYSTGDDGDLEKGVAWPSPRFTDNGNGTAMDKLTGLMWTKNANLGGGTKTWQQALDLVKTLSTGGYSDWRLPNRKELFSLIDYSKHNPPLSDEAIQLFQNVQFGDYWTSTTYAANPSIGWFVNMVIGYVYISSKSDSNYVWAVRSAQGVTPRKALADFDGDGKSDITIWRPENGYWYIIRSSQGLNQVQWGAEGDIPVPGDYDGDGKTDIAVWRPSRCYWYIIRSSDGIITYTLWGALNDIPVPGDFDGDGKTDIAIWRPSTGTWYIIRSSDQVLVQVQWGAPEDIPVPGDFDGDGKADIAVWRPSRCYWYIIRSSDGG